MANLSRGWIVFGTMLVAVSLFFVRGECGHCTRAIHFLRDVHVDPHQHGIRWQFGRDRVLDVNLHFKFNIDVYFNVIIDANPDNHRRRFQR